MKKFFLIAIIFLSGCGGWQEKPMNECKGVIISRTITHRNGKTDPRFICLEKTQ